MTPQTVSLDIAKQLKEAEWSKICAHYFCEYPEKFIVPIVAGYDEDGLQAPQMHEILEELPEYVKVEKFPDGWHVSYKKIVIANYDTHTGDPELYKNPHDALALLWIRLIKEGYITLN